MPSIMLGFLSESSSCYLLVCWPKERLFSVLSFVRPGIFVSSSLLYFCRLWRFRSSWRCFAQRYANTPSKSRKRRDTTTNGIMRSKRISSLAHGLDCWISNISGMIEFRNYCIKIGHVKKRLLCEKAVWWFVQRSKSLDLCANTFVTSLLHF